MIISDPHFAINISPFTIYLIDRHGELNPEYVERLNNDYELTGRVFRFKHIECSTGQLSSFMSTKYSSYLERCNVLVRLFPNEKQYFYYMIDTIQYKCSYEYLHYNLTNLIATISYQDSKETWLYWCRIGGNVSHLYETLLGFFATHSNILKRNNELFILNKVFPNDSDALLSDYSKKYLLKSIHRHVCSIPRNDLVAIEELFEIPCDKDSDKLFYDVLQGNAGISILTDFYFTQIKDESIDVSVEIKSIDYYTAGSKPQFQFDFIIDNERVSIYIGQTTSALIYLYILLFAKAGKKIYRENLRQHCGIGNLPPYLEYLKDAYNIFFDTINDSLFRNWINGINEKYGRNLNQGKSNINKLLGEGLSKLKNREKVMKSLQYLKVERYKHNNETAYGIKLDSRKIFIPNEFNFIVKRLKDYDFDKKFGG